MQRWVVKRVTENVNSQRNIQWSSEHLHVIEDFFFVHRFLKKQYISATSILTLLLREITEKKCWLVPSCSMMPLPSNIWQELITHKLWHHTTPAFNPLNYYASGTLKDSWCVQSTFFARNEW